MATVDTLLTANEYYLLPDDGRPTELVRGRIVPMNVPAPRHGYLCAKLVRILGNWAEDHDLGRVMCNDSGVVTERNPDTVRGPDVAFYSYKRLPKGPIPKGYLPAVPELVFEVRSPTDRWSEVLEKVVEYLHAGVDVVCVLDEQTERLHVFHGSEESPQVLTADDDFTLPQVLGDFRARVGRLFE